MLKGKSAIVTGSTSGIGLGIATALAAAGVDIMLNGFGDAAAIAQLRWTWPRSTACAPPIRRADMSKPADIRAMVKQAEDAVRQRRHPRQQCRHPAHRSGRGVSRPRSGTRSSRSTSRRASTPSAPRCRGMKRRGWGRIINIASAHGLVASTHKAAYVAAKHGLVGLTKVVALETAKDRRHLQRDLPGLGADAAGPEADRRRGGREEDHRRAGQARHAGREAADAGIHHARAARRAGAVPVGDGAATMTGAALSMDGGWVAQ